MTRREFTSILGTASLAAAAPAKTLPVVCVFSKHMAQFGYDELGKRAKDIGFQGIDLTVRPKGHVLPERAAQDLPRAVEAIRAHGLTVPMITTDIKSAADPNARAILSGAGKLKIPYWKVGYHTYTRDLDPPDRLHQTRALVELLEDGAIDAVDPLAQAREIGRGVARHGCRAPLSGSRPSPFHRERIGRPSARGGGILRPAAEKSANPLKKLAQGSGGPWVAQTRPG